MNIFLLKRANFLLGAVIKLLVSLRCYKAALPREIGSWQAGEKLRLACASTRGQNVRVQDILQIVRVNLVVMTSRWLGLAWEEPRNISEPTRRSCGVNVKALGTEGAKSPAFIYLATYEFQQPKRTRLPRAFRRANYVCSVGWLRPRQSQPFDIHFLYPIDDFFAICQTRQQNQKQHRNQYSKMSQKFWIQIDLSFWS